MLLKKKSNFRLSIIELLFSKTYISFLLTKLLRNVFSKEGSLEDNWVKAVTSKSGETGRNDMIFWETLRNQIFYYLIYIFHKSTFFDAKFLRTVWCKHIYCNP